jgi:hypothetical protein
LAPEPPTRLSIRLKRLSTYKLHRRKIHLRGCFNSISTLARLLRQRSRIACPAFHPRTVPVAGLRLAAFIAASISPKNQKIP